MVPEKGFEPLTSCLSDKRLCRLGYSGVKWRKEEIPTLRPVKAPSAFQAEPHPVRFTFQEKVGVLGFEPRIDVVFKTTGLAN